MQESPGARERLLSAALELFRDRGYAAASVREIVERAGVTKPVLYYYFGSKEGIYLEIMKAPFAGFAAIIGEASEEGGGACDRLLALCDRVFLLFVEHLDVARLMYSIYYGPQQGAPYIDFEAHHTSLQETVAELVRRGVAAGEFAAVEVEDLAVVLVGVLNMAMEEQLCRHAPRIDRERLRRILATVLQSMRGEGGV
ncbi:MAG TPA: TetR/AcrR family transcriptional regulator [Verrucomicrobiae bacterium]|nr:TetR/AcrR family transcriptional regulator [Verrucomicrobiae bacterium]